MILNTVILHKGNYLACLLDHHGSTLIRHISAIVINGLITVSFGTSNKALMIDV